jgi:ABC-type nitrate/sulfonate/bicarbonate transport system substrate-binding protein
MPLTIARRRFLAGASAAGLLTQLPRRARAATPFAMQAVWINDAEFMGYMIAADDDYCAEEGLDLTYFPGGPDVIPETSIISGKSDLALTPGLPRSGGPSSVLVHAGSWRYGCGGRRSCAGRRSRRLHDLRGRRAIAQR